MFRAARLPLLLVFACMVVPLTTHAAGDAARGKEIYESRCFACHSVDANRVGPMHMGVFGRRVGKVADFEYSKALKKSKVVWNDKTLDQWLANPEKLIPGQVMGFQVQEAADRADIIAYLKTLKETK